MSSDLEVDTLHKLIATKRILHTPVSAILSELSITKAQFYKIIATEEYKGILREISEEATSHAILTWRGSMEKLIAESHRVLTERLAKNDLEAVKIVLKSIGIDNQVPTQQSTNLQVILPDFTQGKKVETIDVK